MKKKVLALVMSAALFASMLPSTVLADVEENADAQTEDADAIEEAEPDEDAIADVEEEDSEDAVEEEVQEDLSAEDEEADQEDEPDTGEEAVEEEGDFSYEDSDLTLRVHISGMAELPDTEEAISWEDVTMDTSILEEDDNLYTQMESYAEESESDLSDLIAVTLSFSYEDTELDVSDCDIEVEVEPSQEILDAALEDASDEEDEEQSVEVSVVEVADEEVAELDSTKVTAEDTEDVELSAELSEDNFGIMVLSEGDPEFTVQFYANLDVIYRDHHGDDTDLSVIETHTDTGPVLPTNGTTPSTSVVELTQNGSGDYVLDSENVLTQMYTDENYDFDAEPDVHYMNKLELNNDYELIEIWKLNEGGNSASKDNSNEDWTVYSVQRIGDTENYTREMTNSKETYDSDPDYYILVEDNDVFRFVYNTTENTANLDTNFYDYNITDGKVYSEASTSSSAWTSGTKYVYTQESGINAASNYTGSGAKYAFGNENTGTGLGTEEWKGNRINANNGSSHGNGYEGCAFQLVQSLQDDTVSFSDGIIAPNVFYGEAAGKETFTGQLFFNREGDTYTLSRAQLSDGTDAGTGLETFTGRDSYSDGTSFNKTIYSNDFWPMDKVSYDGMDPLFGNYADYKAGNVIQRFNSSGTTGALPPSDDSTDHNSYFGMNFEIEFSYTSDYVGPLEYFFFGDDDMWVFLDGELILDIGGVHSSVGEHVDLWDYLSKDPQPTADGEPTTYTHTLSVYYTERGASGSTCYIQYTLPSVTSITPVDDASNLLIEKEVEGAKIDDQDYEFTVELKDGAGEDAKELTNQYSYIVLNEAGDPEYSDVIKSGGTFTLKDGWYAVLRNLPNGTVATVTETGVSGCSTTYEVGKYTEGTVTESGTGLEASGTVVEDDTTYIKFINTFPWEKGVDTDADGKYDDSGVPTKVGDTLEYKIDYANYYDVPATVTITDVLDPGLDFVEASDGGTYDEETRTITWVLEDVEAGTEGSVTFSAIVNKDALEVNEVENTAKVKVGDSPEVETNPVYNPVPDKDVDIHGDGSYGDSGLQVAVGDTLTYKIDYQNSDDDPATVTITDVLDVGLDFVEASDGGTYNEEDRTITWVIEDVAPHSEEGYYVTFKATVNEDALVRNVVDNTATVQVGEHKPQQTKTVWNPLESDTKDVDADGNGEYGDSGVGVQVGDKLDYVITYFNDTEDAATVTITDVLDEGLDYVEGSASDDGTYDEETRTITWVIEDVKSLTGGRVTFSATVNENAWVKNEVENRATLQYGDDPGYVVETEPVYNPVPDKDVDIHGDGTYGDSGLQVAVGDTLTYKIEYQNSDDDPATVTITDKLDVGLDFVEASDGGTYNEEDRTITWVLEDVAPHSTEDNYVTFTAIVNKDALVRNVVDNTATVQVGEHEPQQTKTVWNPLESDAKDVDANGDGIYGDSGMQVQVGDTLNYEISYFNDNEDAATVTITDVLDEGLDYVENSASKGGTYNEETRTITWVIEDVEPLTGGRVTFSAKVNENAWVKNEVENTAELIYGDDPGYVVETEPVYNPVPDKDVDIHGDGTYGDSGLQVLVGDTLTYKIEYQNSYDEAVTVTITDVLDEGLDFVEASDGGTYNEEDRTITWILENVPPHSEEDNYVTFTATVNENALVKHEVDNTATVQVGEHEAQQTRTVYNPVPEKDVDANEDGIYGDTGLGVQVGDVLTYEISYFNGNDEEATVTITDVLDDGLTYVSSDPEGTLSIDEDGHTVVTWTFEKVEAHTGGSVTFTATVNENALVRNEVENTATVQVGDDPETAIETKPVYNPVPDKDVDIHGDGTYGDSGLQVQVGDTLTYKIDYQNSDDEAATVTITDELDIGLDFVEASDGGTYDESTRTITWVLENVAPHSEEGYNVTFTATVNEEALVKKEVDNTATVQVGEHEPQQTKTVWNPLNQKDVDSDGDGSFGDNGKLVDIGDVLTYSIAYYNVHDEEAIVTITDTLDEGLTYVDGSATDGGTYDASTHTITWVLTVPAHTDGIVYFDAEVNENAEVINGVNNTAKVQVNDDPSVTSRVWNPLDQKDVDADGDGEYGDSGREVQIGDTLTYEIIYTNYEETEATVTITDVLDIGLDFVEASDGGTYDESTRTITWVIENVEAETCDSVTFTATVNKNAAVNNEVENTASIQVGDDPAFVTNTVYNPVPDKDVDADGDGEYGDTGLGVQVGDTLTYEIDFKNSYDEAATVTITDTLDEGLDFVEASDGGIYNGRTHTITWIIEDVEAHTTGSVTFTVTVNETALVKNEVDNTATVEIGEDSAQTNTVYNPVPDKNVDADGDDVYEDSGMQVQIGDTLVYKIDYENPDDEAATVTITDVLDEGLDFVDASDGGIYNGSTHTVIWIIEDVEAHTSGSVYFTATVNESALEKHEVDNTATVQVGDHPSQDTKTVYNPVPEKGVDANDDGTYDDNGLGVQVGDTVAYEITYFNGNDQAATVTITDTLDEGLDFVEASDGGTYNRRTHTITWVIEDVEAYTGGSVTFTATVNETALVRNEVDNTATVEVGNNSVDTNTVYNPIPDKNVDADGDDVYEDSGVQVQVGDTLVYKIDYENPDDKAATVTIMDVLDEGLDFVEATDDGSYDEGSRTITWVITEVEPHTNGSVYFTATVNENALEKHEVDNTATVQVGDHPSQDTKTVYNPVPEKGVDANDDGIYEDDGLGIKVGDTVAYEITYFNGNDEAATVTITDVLEEGLDFVSASDDGKYTARNHTITWVIEDVEAHSGGSVTFTATVNENALVRNEVDNTATVEIGHDSIDTNTVYNPVPNKDVDVGLDGSFGDSGVQVKVGDTLVYKIAYQNSDESPATVTITDELDIGLDFEYADQGGTYDEATRTITWVIEDVEPHSEEGNFVLFVATVNENALEKHEVENTAVVKVGDHPAQQTETVYNPLPDTDQLSVSKEVSGNGDTSEYEFRVTLKVDGDAYNGDVTATTDDGTSETVTFADGVATITVAAGKTLTLDVPYGADWEVVETTDDADSVLIYVDGNVVERPADKSQAYAAAGTIWDTTEVEFINSYREYFPIDEEIVTDEEDIFDEDAWVKSEAVNEYNAIEIEMTTTLPVITAYDMENGAFTLNFHNVLDHELILDEDTADFSVYIGEKLISTAYYRITFDEDTGDDCNFHVDVDLTALYKDGVITDEDLTGDTEISVFFFADLEGTGLNGTYTSTIWYDVMDGDEILYTSNEDVVYVYTYEIEIQKYDSETGDALAGATLGLYYDEDCTDPVIRSDEPYTVVSGEDGLAIFYGLGDGTYYVTELEAPAGYELSDEVLEVVLSDALNDNEYKYEGSYANTPEPGPTPETVNVKGSKTWNDNDDEEGKRPESITINLLANGEVTDTVTVTEAENWAWSFTDLAKDDEDGNEITYTITEDAVTDYTTTYDGYDVTNTYEGTEPTPSTVNVPVTKVWDDDNDLEGVRPSTVEIELYKNGESTGRVLVLSEENSWSSSFDDLDEYTDDVKNVYTVEEQEVGDYTSTISGDVETGFVVTNTYNPAAGTTSPGPTTGGNTNPTSGTSGTSGTGGTSGTSSPKTADTDLPILPIVGCCAAIALITGVLVVRRKRDF